MADSLFEDILGMLGQKGVAEVAQKAGTDTRQTQAASAAAVAALLKGLSDNAGNQQEATELLEALKRDHWNFDPQQAPAAIEKSDPGLTAQILGHIFGKKQEKVERQLGNATGVGQLNMGKILASLAPVVLGMLANRSKQSQVQSGPDLSKWLGQQTTQMKESHKDLGFLESILDADHDGDVDIGDIAGMIGKFMGGSR